MTDILLIVVIVILMAVLRRTRQRKKPYRGLFTTLDTAIRRETEKVLGALRVDVPGEPMPGHWLLAEVSDEHTGLLCGIAARPGPARLRIKMAVHDRIKKADMRLEDTMRTCLGERPRRMSVKRMSGEIVILDRRDSSRYEKYNNPPEPQDTDFALEIAEKLLTDREPDNLWETAYNTTVTMKDSWNTDMVEFFEIVTFYGQGLKGPRKDFGKVHRMTFGGNPPPPYSDDRETPLKVSVAEAELAYSIIADWVWRLAAGRSRRLNLLLWHMKRLRKAMLREFPAYANALDTAATENEAYKAKAVGESLHKLPNRVVKAMAECMTDMERSFAGAGVFANIEARAEKPRDITAEFDWSFRRRWLRSDDREPARPAPAYARTLGSRSFRRKMGVVLGQDITMAVTSAYDDAMSARRLRARIAAACREHGAALLESAEDMPTIVENHSRSMHFGSPESLNYRKLNKHEMFRQAVEDAVASVLCEEVEPQTEEDASPHG